MTAKGITLTGMTARGLRTASGRTSDAVLVLDGAGYHNAGNLVVPDNITGLVPHLWRAFSVLRGLPLELKRADEVQR